MRRSPVRDPAVRAVRMALAMREHLAPLRDRWRAQPSWRWMSASAWPRARRPSAWLSCAGRVDYAILGPVMELAVALCDAAPPGQILLSPAVWTAVAGWVEAVPVTIPGLPNGTDPRAVMRLQGVYTPS